MPKINEFVLQENIIDLMKEKLRDSRKTNIESGFPLCANKDNIIDVRNITKITDKETFLSSDCPPGYKSVGHYHAHPDIISNASAEELLNACSHIGDCIGGDADNRIKCYTRKKDVDPIDCTKEFSVHRPIETDLRAKYNYHEQRRELLLKDKERVSMIEPRTRKVDMELRGIVKKMKEYNDSAQQSIKEMNSFNQKLLIQQNKYFDEIEIR